MRTSRTRLLGCTSFRLVFPGQGDGLDFHLSAGGSQTHEQLPYGDYREGKQGAEGLFRRLLVRITPSRATLEVGLIVALRIQRSSGRA